MGSRELQRLGVSPGQLPATDGVRALRSQHAAKKPRLEDGSSGSLQDGSSGSLQGGISAALQVGDLQSSGGGSSQTGGCKQPGGGSQKGRGRSSQVASGLGGSGSHKGNKKLKQGGGQAAQAAAGQPLPLAGPAQQQPSIAELLAQSRALCEEAKELQKQADEAQQELQKLPKDSAMWHMQQQLHATQQQQANNTSQEAARLRQLATQREQQAQRALPGAAVPAQVAEGFGAYAGEGGLQGCLMLILL